MSFIKALGLMRHKVAIWSHRHAKVLSVAGAVAGVFLVGNVTYQVIYPSGHALPGAHIGSQAIGRSSYDSIVEQIAGSFASSEITIMVGEASETLSLSHLGAEPEAEAMAQHLIDYPLWQRLLPLSLFVRQPRVTTMQVTFDDQQLGEAAQTLAEKLSSKSEDARLIIAEGKLAATPAKPGHTVSPDDIVGAITKGGLSFGTTRITLAGEEAAPAITDEDIAPVREQAEAIIARKFTIAAEDGREFIPDTATIASWLKVVDGKDGKPELQADRERIVAYIQEINDTVGTKPGTAKATVVDGVEVSRTEAPSGRAIASGELSDSIAKALFDSSASGKFTVRMEPVPPIVSYARSYTSSQKGLRAYVEYVTRSEDIRIAVSQVSGNKWSAYGRASEQFVAASTYKLYVAYMLFHQVATGKMHWNTNIAGADAAGCLERMIVVSDNACAEKFIALFGAKDINTYLYENGISRTTTFIAEDAAKTTAGDLETMLHGIESGSLISGGDRNSLLDKMERQKYRAGIPAGSTGTVQNKVGFLWDYLNDAAIVRHPKGTYTLVILTKGSSWGRIAEITKEIERILYG